MAVAPTQEPEDWKLARRQQAQEAPTSVSSLARRAWTQEESATIQEVSLARRLGTEDRFLIHGSISCTRRVQSIARMAQGQEAHISQQRIALLPRRANIADRCKEASVPVANPSKHLPATFS